jgi:subfamily B ATP-binding cassette protein HlyB/CyaB
MNQSKERESGRIGAPSSQQIDTGLRSLVVLSHYFKMPVELSQLERACVVKPGVVDDVTILRAAKLMHLKARRLQGLSREQVMSLPMPAMLKMKQGNYLVLRGMTGQRGKQELVIHDTRLRMEPVLGDPEKVFADFSGEALLFTHRFTLEEQEPQQKFGWGWFLPVILKYGKFLRNVFIVSLLLQLLGLAFPFFTQEIIDKVLVHRSADALDVLLLGMLLTACFQHGMTALRSYLFSNITSRMDVTLMSRLYQTVLRLVRRMFDRWQVGDIVSRMGELENLRNFLTGSSLTFVLDMLFSVIYLGILFLYSTRLTLVVLVMLPFFLILNLVTAPIYKRLLNRRFLVGSAGRSFLIETITGIHTVKNGGVEQGFIQHYEELLSAFIKASFSVVKLKAVMGSVGLFLQQAYLLLILWVGALQVMDGKLSVGGLIAFQMIANQLILPVMRMVDSWQEFQQARVSMSRLGDLMEGEQEPVWNPGRTTLPGIQGRIELSGVTFSYGGDGNEVLKNLNLLIPAGITVGIVGPSGSGKSTLTKLLQRLYLPQEGRILIDGVDIAQVEPAWLRRQIGVVLQDSMLFAGTVEENIRIALPNASHEEVERAAKLAGAHEFIEKLAHGYETFVGERGSLLSGGQRQRIAIARALITDPRILIFDEATSALDIYSEKAVMQNLAQISRGRTVLLIAHRLATVKDAQAILVMDHGRIVEAGRHEQLMQAKREYYHLWMSQQ